MKKFVLFVSAILIGLGPSAAQASDTELTWERSQMQQVEIDPAIGQLVSNLALIGQGESIEFSLSSQLTPEGRYLYQALIPVSFPL